MALGLLAGIIVASSSPIPVQAYPAGGVYGREEWRGYFTNTYDRFGTAVLQPRWGTQAIPNAPEYNVDTVAELITILRDANNNTANTRDGRNDRTGSAFIVYTMLGLNGAPHDRKVTDVNWAELTKRLDSRQAAGKIIWSGNVNSSVNSIYQDAKNTTDTATDDVAFHDDSKNEDGITILNDDNSIAYEILRRCANPMGNSKGIPPANNWSVSVNSTANMVTARPGNTITWTHRVTNNGPDATNANVLYRYKSNANLGSGQGADSVFAAGSGAGATRTILSTHVVTQNDVGKSLCRLTRAIPRAVNDGSAIESAYSCVNVPYSYTLRPYVTTDLAEVIEPNATVNVTPSVVNTGPTRSLSTQWQVTQIIVAPGKSVPNSAGGLSASTAPPCGNYFRSGSAVCTTIRNGTSIFNESGGVYSGSAMGAIPVVASDLGVGTQICFALSVQPYSSASSNWNHSAPTCLTVGKKPKIQVHGGDLSVGKLFSGATTNTKRVQTSISAKNDAGTRKVFGSWIEYGIFATGTISGAGSRSAYAGPNGSTDVAACAPHRLSFTNALSTSDSTCGSVGRYIPAKLIPNVLASFPGVGEELAIPNAVVPNSLIPATGGSYIGTYDGDIKLNPSTLAPGKSIILKVSGTVTITANQTYDPDNKNARYTELSQLPQLIIIANKIIIESKVTNVDAWLIANGTNGIIETCDTGSTTYVLSTDATKLSSEKCNEPLTINGPVMAKQLWLRRTGGSGVGAQSGDPAEIFNLRPDAYLWATTKASGNGRVQTVYTTELPPRL